jgi:hypothetical protein
VWRRTSARTQAIQAMCAVMAEHAK